MWIVEGRDNPHATFGIHNRRVENAESGTSLSGRTASKLAGYTGCSRFMCLSSHLNGARRPGAGAGPHLTVLVGENASPDDAGVGGDAGGAGRVAAVGDIRELVVDDDAIGGPLAGGLVAGG